jgi:DNA-binding transcriptional MerR regulator
MEIKKMFYSMGEVSEMLDVKPSLVRYWEGQFEVLKPKKNKKGNRLFSPEDVEMLKMIYHLVKERGMTLEGAKKSLKQNKKAISRDSELLERLQRVRSLLEEVREDLKAGEEDLLVEEAVAAPKRTPRVAKAKAKAEPVVAQPNEVDGVADPAPQVEPERPSRRPRARKERASADKELFAFYEQSLFQNSNEN